MVIPLIDGSVYSCNAESTGINYMQVIYQWYNKSNALQYITVEMYRDDDVQILH